MIREVRLTRFNTCPCWEKLYAAQQRSDLIRALGGDSPKRPACPRTHEFAAINKLPLSQILHPDKEAVLTVQRRDRLKYFITSIHPGSIACLPSLPACWP